jgi:hypothetical protein
MLEVSRSDLTTGTAAWTTLMRPAAAANAAAKKLDRLTGISVRWHDIGARGGRGKEMARYTGGCLCRAVRYSIDAEPIAGRQILCHCVDCQKHTGTAFVSGMAFPADSVVITGEMTTYTMPGGSGEPMNRRFCTRCGSPIMIDKDGTGRKLIMAGTLDDKSQFKPVVSLFCEQAPSWVVMPTDTQNLPRYYT